MLTLVIFIIFVALVFDFLNGFHDAANSIATIVSTRVLTPTAAVAWAAFFNFVAAFFFGTAVSETISGGPVIGLLMGTLFMTATAWLFRRSTPNKVDGWFRRLQLFSAAIFSLSHG